MSFEHVLTREKIPQEFYLIQSDKVDKPDKIKGQLFFSFFLKIIVFSRYLFCHFHLFCHSHLFCCFVVNSNMRDCLETRRGGGVLVQMGAGPLFFM